MERAENAIRSLTPRDSVNSDHFWLLSEIEFLLGPTTTKINVVCL